MRIASKTVYDNVKINLNRTSNELLRANLIVSSGKKINKLSDDPVGLVNVLSLRASLENVQQMERNIGTGKSWLNAGESVLSQSYEILTELKALSIQMASSNVNQTERNNSSGIVDGLMRQLLSLANTEVNGRYIFSGTQTDTIPFAFDDVNNPTQVTYSGNDTPFSIKIEKNIDVGVGRDGETIFGDDNFDWSDTSAGQSNIFKTLMDFKTYLENDNVPGIEGIMDKLDSHLETVSAIISDSGIKTIRLEVRETIIADLKLSYTERKSLIEDVDITEAIMNLQAKEVAYKAALSSSSSVLQLSLVDYI
jgi:flagellar hook-associated protein 3 FlgL